ncbi:alpha/beta fold hydrolase [Oleisolibacter albus]|uniref:alpha/beta fold hydrolase n=1 Tax=Oleisolibacter albus TaxID=2171757 RepID=UPI000DF263CE|nr:alpha/beta hydrolase [Oleisolibacter albus]
MLPRFLPRLMAVLLSLVFGGPAAAAFESDRISVAVRGTGPDVVLIPGTASSPEVWESTVAALPSYRYHLVHVAGFAGKPAGANSASGPLLQPVADEIARYIGDAGLKQPALVGHSLGGTLALLVASRHPEAAGKVMVVDMLPFLGQMFGPPGTTAESVEPVAAQLRARTAASSGEARRQIVEATMATMVTAPEQRAAPIAHTLATDPALSGQALYELITTDLRPALKKMTVPLTVLWVRPPTVPLTQEQLALIYAQAYAGAPQARIRHIPNSLHFIMFDAPDAFRSELKSFLAGE